jgi:hypothetical protein
VTGARLLAIMGSGETSPTMAKTHRDLLAQVAAVGPAVLLDTPFGFQENASDIAAKAVEYFRESVGATMEVASFRSAQVEPLARETALARLRAGGYVFAGPGSPSYALRQWRDSLVPSILSDKVRAGGTGGCVTFASAAALTLGLATVPVYEIYKVGEDPQWLEGLDLLSAATGLRAAVIPHYNNAEGGNHDTRYCYLGERRLQLLESALPEGAFVLGVDEHTGLVLDLDAGRASVVGLGVVTVRRGGQSTVFPSGTELGIEELGSGSGVDSGVASRTAPTVPQRAAARSPLLDTVAGLESEFAVALADRDPGAAVAAALALDDALVAWSRDTLQSDEMDRARGALRSMIVRLGELAAAGTKDPAELVGPFVEALLHQRSAARDGQRWADADAVRDRLVALGVEVNDGPEGTTWRLLS